MSQEDCVSIQSKQGCNTVMRKSFPGISLSPVDFDIATTDIMRMIGRKAKPAGFHKRRRRSRWVLETGREHFIYPTNRNTAILSEQSNEL